MKTLKIMLAILTLSLGVVSCTNEDGNTVENTESNMNNNLQNRASNSTGINIIYQNKKFELLEDKSVAYFNTENIYQGDIILTDNDIQIEDNSTTSGEIILTNSQTNEVVTVYNIRTENNNTVFDLKGSNGLVYAGMEVFEQASVGAKGGGIVGIIVKAVVAIVTVVAVSTSSGGTQQDCMNSQPKKCPGGKSPYAEYSSGWFETSCSVGCR